MAEVTKITVVNDKSITRTTLGGEMYLISAGQVTATTMETDTIGSS